MGGEMVFMVSPLHFESSKYVLVDQSIAMEVSPQAEVLGTLEGANVNSDSMTRLLLFF
jgi:hypothetical protein